MINGYDGPYVFTQKVRARVEGRQKVILWYSKLLQHHKTINLQTLQGYAPIFESASENHKIKSGLQRGNVYNYEVKARHLGYTTYRRVSSECIREFRQCINLIFFRDFCTNLICLGCICITSYICLCSSIRIRTNDLCEL